MQKTEQAETTPTTANEVSRKIWRTPVAHFIPASDAENGPGTPPDSGGFDFS